VIDWIFCPGLHGYFQIPMVKHPTGPGPHFDFRMFHVEIQWMEEILHQLIGGKHPIIYRASTIPGGLSDFATIHRMLKFPRGKPRAMAVTVSSGDGGRSQISRVYTLNRTYVTLYKHIKSYKNVYLYAFSYTFRKLRTWFHFIK